MYKQTGEEVANYIHNMFDETNINLERTLEWGCGPGRVIRHLRPRLQGEMHGTDYNTESIDWCKKNLPGIVFQKNKLNPPLNYNDNYFDFVYAISVFTHLSEKVSLMWIKELSRILKPGGTLMIWTNGDKIAQFLLSNEKKLYDAETWVVRDNYKEGKKMFLSFHHPKLVRNKLLREFEIVKHFPGGFTGIAQDIWVARQPAN